VTNQLLLNPVSPSLAGPGIEDAPHGIAVLAARLPGMSFESQKNRVLSMAAGKLANRFRFSASGEISGTCSHLRYFRDIRRAKGRKSNKGSGPSEQLRKMKGKKD